MDPASILGIAAAVAQFIDFSATVIGASSKIFKASHGSTADSLTLEDACIKLRDLSRTLEIQPQTEPTERTVVADYDNLEVPDYVNPKIAVEDFLKPNSPLWKKWQRQVKNAELKRNLSELSTQCHSECDNLLRILEKLRVNDGKSRLWRSVKAGLRTALKAPENAQLEQKLERTQQLMMLHVGEYTREEILALHQDLEQMNENNKRLHTNHSDNLNRLYRIFKDLRLKSGPTDDCQRVDTDTAATEGENESRRPDDFNSGLEKLLVAYRDFSRQSAILNSLNFPSRPSRLQDIPGAHEGTFRWMYDSTLAKWLQTGTGIFWISGKAGSGKSCFMKFLVAQSLPKSGIEKMEEGISSVQLPGTIPQSSAKDLLVDWAQPKEVAVVSHCFWSAGTKMQRSQHGLLQSLLFDMFKACPACLPFACNSRWKDAESNPDSVQQQPWSIGDLVEALEVLSKHSALPTKFCCFIDGLDEFEGDHSHLCDTILKFSKSANLKICLASRPLNIFTDGFGKCPMLCIHDFTMGDIAFFARQQLQLHPRWAFSMSQSERERMITAITARANGVFLWVYLVTRSLRDGLTNDDDADELQRRLDGLLNQLENLFLSMLDSVEKVYHDKMAGNFLLALNAWEPLNLDLYAFHDKEYGNNDYAIDWSVNAIPDVHLDLIRARIGRRLNASSQGLLESKGGSVQLLHRTVRDFLRLTDMSQFLISKAPPLFDPALSITKAYLALIKSTNFSFGTASPSWTLPRPVRRNSPGNNSGWLIQLLDECFRYASAVNASSKSVIANVLDNLELSVIEKFRSGQARFYFGHCDPKVLFCEQLIRSDLQWYLASKITASPEYLRCMEAPPLFVASRPPFVSRASLAFLLSRPGAGPNEESRDIPEGTPWLAFSAAASALEGHNSNLTAAARSGLFSLYLAHGADPNAHQPLDSMTVFGIFLLGVCFFGFEEGAATAYLQALSDFIQAGAILDIEVDSRYFMPLETSEQGSTALVRVFLHCLETHQVFSASSRRGWERFIAQVVTRIIHDRVLRDEFLTDFKNVIASTFTGAIPWDLMQTISGVKSSSKRSSSGESSGLQGSKKQKVG